MLCSALHVERRCDVAKKKKEDLPAYTLVEMPEWKTKVLDLMLVILNVPGKAWVIAVKDSGFDLTADGYYTHRDTGIKIPKDKKENGSDRA